MLNAKNTEFASYTASGITFLDSISIDAINTFIAIIGVIGTLAINLYFTWREDRRKEAEHKKVMEAVK